MDSQALETQAAIERAERSPEVVAARAAVHLLMQQETVISREVQRLSQERQALQADLASMFITKQDAAEALRAAQRHHKDLQSQIATIYEQVVAVRDNVSHLISQRNQLKTHVETLHSEIALLERARIGASRALAAASNPVIRDRRQPPRPPKIAPDGSIITGAQSQADIAPHIEAAEDAAFNDFFNTGLEHDKAREWILSDAQ